MKCWKNEAPPGCYSTEEEDDKVAEATIEEEIDLTTLKTMIANLMTMTATLIAILPVIQASKRKSQGRRKKGETTSPNNYLMF